MPCYDNVSGTLRHVGDIYVNVGGTLHSVDTGYDNVNGVLRKYHRPLELADISYVEFWLEYQSLPSEYENQYTLMVSSSSTDTGSKYFQARTTDRSGLHPNGDRPLRESVYWGEVCIHLNDGRIIPSSSEKLKNLGLILSYSISYSGTGSSSFVWYYTYVFGEYNDIGGYERTMPAPHPLEIGVGLERGTSGSTILTIKSIKSGSTSIPFCLTNKI